MERSFSLPDGRDFRLVGQVRLAHSAADPIVDQALGLPDADHGGVTASSKRRLPGGLSNRSMNAIDGDPDTWYSPGFLDQHNEYVDYEVAEPITFDHLDLTVLNDGRHSVPRSMTLSIDGKPVQRLALPDIADQKAQDSRHTFHVELDKPATGSRVTLVVDPEIPAVRDVETLDWFTDRPLVMPMGIVELGIDGLEAPALPDQIDPACREDLVTVDGEPVPVSLVGTTADLLAGKAIDLVACEDAPLSITAGTSQLRTARGRDTGLDLDRLVLRSAPGGDADTATGPLIDPSTQTERPAMEITDQTRTSVDVRVPSSDEEFWLVLGQSYNAGWHATADGKDLGAPTLVNGYANGWRVPAGTDIEVHVEWTPQRVVQVLMGLSVGAVLAALALILWPRSRRPAFVAGHDAGAAHDHWVPLAERPSMPLALSFERVRRYTGPTPSLFALVAGTLSAIAVGFAMTGPIGAIVLGIAAAVTLRVASARPLLTIGGPAVFALAVAWMIARQLVTNLPPGFDWPTYFEAVQNPAWIAVLLLLLDAVVERCWLRRWWATDASTSA